MSLQLHQPDKSGLTMDSKNRIDIFDSGRQRHSKISMRQIQNLEFVV
jgi:hypothetical protein